MANFRLFAILTTMVLAGPGELPKVVAVIRNAYAENVTALSAFGTIHFHATDGQLGRASNAEEIRAVEKRLEATIDVPRIVRFRRPEASVRELIPTRRLGRSAGENVGIELECTNQCDPIADGWRNHAHG